jgi:ABC-type phosphate transport system substrate-binding protein
MQDSISWKWFLVFLVAAGVALVDRSTPAQESGPGFRVIVHAGNSTPSATPAEVSRLMLKKSINWEDGTDAYPIDLDSSSPVREAFSQAIHGRSTPSIVKFWQRQIFSGRVVPPPTVASDEQVVAYVRSHPGGIGYVSPVFRLEGVRELAVIDR